MKHYEKYQCVDQRWVKSIPSHWEFFRLKRIFAQRVEKNDPIITENILSLTAKQGVVPYAEKEGSGGNKPKGDMTQYNIARPNDLLVNCMNIVAGSAGVSRYFGAISPVYYALYPRLDCNVWYYHYLFRLMPFQRSLIGLGKGILMHESESGALNTVRMRISMDYLGNVNLPIPPRDEQDQIVRYLDWQVSKINRLISAKRKQITVLQEQLKHCISDTVFRGISDDIILKDSGVEWIGTIPEHWSVIRCKYVFAERDECSIAGEEEHLSMSQKYGLVPDAKLDERRMLSESYAGGKICYKDDLVLNRLKAHLGVFALSPQKGVVSPDYTVLVPNTERILPAYGEAVLKSDLCRRELRIRVRGIIEGFWRLYTDDFNTVVIPLPPLKEQEQIMEYLNTLNGKFTALKQNLEQEIATLQDLRTCLISDVVTGQMDVRSIEVPEFEYVGEVTEANEVELEDSEEVD